MTMGVWEWGHVAIGGVASLIFLFQSLGSADSDDASPGSEADAIGASDAADADGMAGTALSDYLSVRNFVAFFIGYGWVTFAGLYNGLSRIAASVAGTVSGIIFVFVSLFLLRAFLKFQEDGSLKLETLEGRRAYVYIAIMGSAANTGKVMVDGIRPRGTAGQDARRRIPPPGEDGENPWRRGRCFVGDRERVTGKFRKKPRTAITGKNFRNVSVSQTNDKIFKGAKGTCTLAGFGAEPQGSACGLRVFVFRNT